MMHYFVVRTLSAVAIVSMLGQGACEAQEKTVRSALPVIAKDSSGTGYHAIVSSVAVGKKPDFNGEQGEFPVYSDVHLKQPVKELILMINGAVISVNAAHAYADVLFGWNGLKFQRGGTPITDRTELKNMKVNLHFADGSSATRAIEPASDGDMYSFKQNRILMHIQSPKDIVRISFDTSSRASKYRGFLRVQLFGVDRTVDPAKGCKTHTVRFEEYGQDDNDQCIGGRLSIRSKESFVFEGDFLLPVGLEVESGRTLRKLKGLIGDEDIQLEISGLFIFSGYQPDGDGKQIGGGGGFQDAGWRFNHLKFLVPETPYRTKTKVYDSELKILDSNGGLIKYSSRPTQFSKRHTYTIGLQVPEDGVLYFYINDGGKVNETLQTEDNSGALLVRLL